MDTLKELIGSKIIAVEANAEKTLLKFITNNGEFLYIAYGDCCSESWINHVSGLEFVLLGVVKSVEELPEIRFGQKYSPDDDDECYFGDVTKIYQYLIKTDKGTCCLEMRNSSNGYYGGSLEFTTHLDPTQGYYLEHIELENLTWKQITEDF